MGYITRHRLSLGCIAWLILGAWITFHLRGGIGTILFTFALWSGYLAIFLWCADHREQAKSMLFSIGMLMWGGVLAIGIMMAITRWP